MNRKRRPHRYVLSTASFASILLLAGCVGDGSNGNETTDAAGDPDDTVLRFAHEYEPEHPAERCAVPAVQEALDGSGVTIESYTSGQLGTDAEMLEQINDGSLDIGMVSAATLATWYEPVSVVSAGYLFDDVEHAEEVIDSGLLDELYDDLQSESGFVVSDIWYYGTRHLTSNTPIAHPDELDGVQVRVPDSELLVQTISAMGGSPTPMALSEVYTGLQQGTLDAQENPIPTIDSNGFYEVQDHLNLTGHIVDMVHIVTSDTVLESLDSEQVTAWEDAVEAGRTAMRECVLQEEEETIETWREDGTMTVNEVDFDAFSDRVAAEMSEDEVLGDVYNEIREEG